MVAEWRDAAAGRDAQPRLEHAAEHYAHAQGTRRVGDANRLADPARLRELDVDAVGDLGAPRDVGERVAVLVDVDRNRRTGSQLAPTVVARPERLLAVLHSELAELLERVERFLERPPLVHVDHQREIGRRPYGTHALDVEAVSSAELELEPPERLRSLLGAAGHVVRISEPDGPRGRRASAREPEQPVRWHAEELALQIVQRSVERRLRRLLAGDGGEALADVLERERIVADEPAVVIDETLGRCG